MAKQDIGQEILDGLREIKRGKGKRRKVKLPADVKNFRERMSLSQSAFAALLRVADRHPNVLLEA